MDKKFGLYLLLGLVIGAMYGTFFGYAVENTLLGVALGAFSGVFLGWFVAVAVREQKIKNNKISEEENNNEGWE